MPDQETQTIPFPGWPRVGGGSGDGPAAGGPAAPAAPAAADGTGEPGDDSVPIDLEQVAADFEAEALATLTAEGEPGDKGDGSGKGKAAAATPADADPIDEFIQQNYGGNKAAFVASLHESRREAKRLSDEVAVLKASRTPEAARDVMAEFKAERDSSPEVQAIDREIKIIDGRTQAVQTRQIDITKLATTVNNAIVELESTLPLTEDVKELTKGQAKLIRLRAELSELSGEFNVNASRMEQFELRRNAVQRELVRAENDIKRSMIAKEDQQRTDVTNGQRTRSAFAAAFDASVKEYGLEPTSETYIYLRDASRTQLADYLDSLGDDADGLDAAGIFEAVGKLVAAGARAFKLQPKSTVQPKPRVPITPRPILTPRAPARSVEPSTPSRASGRPPSKEDLESDPNYWRDRAGKVFEASGREALRRSRTGLG